MKIIEEMAEEIIAFTDCERVQQQYAISIH